MNSVDHEYSLHEGRYSYLHIIQSSDVELMFTWLKNKLLFSYKPYLAYLCPTEQKLKEYIIFKNEIDPPIEIECLILTKPNKQPIGLVSLQSIDYYNKKAELSFVVIQQGFYRLCFEVIWKAVSFSFNELHLEKLYFYVIGNNTRFLDSLKKRDWKPEAVLMKEILIDGQQRVDVYRFSIFPEDLNMSFWKDIKRCIKVV
ncbi:MAG: GNAT family N-acetyltransferase [Desulfobacterales bacterium]|nr:GNAT family N-acetyltransferase [Desulfobacterales bacterium]